MPTPGLDFDDWLLTESVRRREERVGRWPDDAAAVTLATRAGSDLSDRLVARARALPGSEAAKADIRSLHHRARQFIGLLVVLGLLLGWLAARTSTLDRELDLLLAGATLIGLPTLMLLLWLVLMPISARWRSSASPRLALLHRALAWSGPRLFDSELAGELAQSASSALSTPAGRWWLGLSSHLLWLAYSAGAILALTIYFSVAQYDLSWGTTILSESTVIGLIQALAGFPAQIGLMPILDEAFIERGRVGQLAGADRALWAHFLMVLMLVYVALPRLLLVLLSWIFCRRAARRMGLDTGRAGYLRLQADLMPDGRSVRRLGEAPTPTPRRPRRRSAAADGPAVLIGVELAAGIEARLAEALGDRVTDLGPVSSRTQRHAVEQALKGLKSPPPLLVAVCSLLRTPDTGTSRLLDRLADASRSALLLVLVDGAQLTARGDDRTARREDWTRLAEQVGGDWIEIEASDVWPGEFEALAARIDSAKGGA
ncbi:DUF2868 domain-containing protein [Wenzhouxiangella marina]|uniref:Uncharacterized protein n=1 Tax=Wenzhouxiangella marina TaxID=1579979 RepID=A0A0K0XZI7_9GAMM|nr:DUF2868 domain-containing protein [Wenzhouxiangella marina]AKS43103.1 hypothetical protein WM2015_2746 [Wenzhouxiangella marina]MBB6087212.1 hypothetical protein [Wenzhouxiangella marina]